MERQILTPQERIALTEKIATSYRDAYKKQAVKDGGTYTNVWKFAKGATYWSPYFGNTLVDLEANPICVEDCSSFEALSYSIEFDNWGPVEFFYYPSVNGVAWRTHFKGWRKRDGEPMEFFSYSYVDINEYGEITHWETHVNRDYDAFLDEAIGTHGPFAGNEEYMVIVINKIKSAGIDITSVMQG